MTDINTRFNNAVNDVVTEATTGHWKRAIEATIEIATMIKSSGLSKQVYMLVMENLEIAMKKAGGESLLLDFAHALKHKDHYLNNSVIVLPRRL